MESLVEGFKLMIPAITILIFAWSLKGIGDAMGLAEFVGGIVGENASASIFIPVVLFAVAMIATGMFAGNTSLEMMIISVSAVLAGAVCGDHVSPISDTTVMSSAGAQSNHLNHVSTQMQYAAIVAGVCMVGYIIAALTKIWWLTLGISLLILLAILMGMKIVLSKRQAA